jgi:hypothetical protein
MQAGAEGATTPDHLRHAAQESKLKQQHNQQYK